MGPGTVLLREEIGRAGELRQSTRHLDFAFFFAGGMNDNRRYEFAQRVGNLFSLKPSAGSAPLLKRSVLSFFVSRRAVSKAHR
jgi:hypothetical protein